MKKVNGYPKPLGVTLFGDRTNFAVAVPAGASCELVLYKLGGLEPFCKYELPESGFGEVRFLALQDIHPWEYEYHYLINGNYAPDPYAKLVFKRDSYEQVRFGFPHSYDWDDDEPLQIPHHEVVAYNLHVRGFTNHTSSGVVNRGTFSGIIEKIAYLQELGVNQIQCMPVYEFEDRQGRKTNYWGYGGGYFFAPKGRYAAAKDSSVELKDMIKACHKAGIEVVFYLPFDAVVSPQTATECLHYYVTEYHVDGFILNPYHMPTGHLQQDPLLAKVKILYQDNQYQNVMRRFLKGDEGMVSDVIWQLKRNTKMDGCFNYVTSHTGFTLQDVYSYDAKHNELNGEYNCDGPDYNYSWNCGAEGQTQDETVTALRNVQVKNAFALLLTSQGFPSILAGDEFGNSQNGNNNVYCQDNELAWLDWNQLEENRELFTYVKNLIALRKACTILHQPELIKGWDYSASGMPDVSYHGENAWKVPSEVSSRLLGVYYSGAATKEMDCFVAYNMHWMDHTVALPNPGSDKNWYLAMQTEDGVLDEPQLLDDQRKIEMKPRSVRILVGR